MTLNEMISKYDCSQLTETLEMEGEIAGTTRTCSRLDGEDGATRGDEGGTRVIASVDTVDCMCGSNIHFFMIDK